MATWQSFASKRANIIFVLLTFVFGTAHPLFADSPQVDWPLLRFTPAVLYYFNHPVVITHAGDNSGRLLVVEQGGRIWIVQSNNVLRQPFLDISGRVLSAGAEQGLVGLAFPPGFSTNSHFYVDYTRQPDGAIVISRFSLTSTNSNVADTNSEQVLLVIPKPYNNHNAGQLSFGPDGYLYIGVGDGGSEGDPFNNGQKTSTLLSKLLRIDVESGVSPYAVPPTNPFVGNTNYAPEIWALGLRNPWRFSFDRQTGDLYIGDVGQNQYEEIDFQPAGSAGGQNYGWRIMEGDSDYIVPPGFTNFSALTLPVAVYSHSSLPAYGDAAVIGGYVYHGPSVPRMDGVYFYGDFINGWIWGLKQVGTNWQNLVIVNPGYSFPATNFSISTFGEDDQGGLYLANYYQGMIYQIHDSLQAWPPMFSPTNGIINSNTVVVTCITTNAEIHYTTNGVDPTLSDPSVASGGTIPVGNGMTNKLRAFRADLSPSAVVSAVFTYQAGTPIFNPPQGPITNGTTVSITCVTPGAAIYYTLDGSTPTTNSAIYTGPVTIDGGVTLSAFATAGGYLNSTTRSVFYQLVQTATPVYSPPLGPIVYGNSISISCATPNAVIYYTADGTTPTTNSAVYSTPQPVYSDVTLSAFAVTPGYLNSVVQSVFYTLPQATTPTLSPSAGPLMNGSLISISSATSNAIIRYTLDGSDPNANVNAFIYSASLSFTHPMTLTARAYRSDLDPSPISSVFYGLLDAESNVIVTTFAGGSTSGLSNAVGTYATFSSPQGVCIDQSGNLYVADTGNNVIRKILPSRGVTTFAGTGVAGSQLGQATNAQFNGPTGVCVDETGNVYVADANNNRICKIDTNNTVTTLANIIYLSQLEIDAGGNVYVGSWASVQKVFPDGSFIQVAGTGVNTINNWGAYVGLGIDAATNIYATTLSRIWETAPDGTTALFAGSGAGFSDGPRMLSLFQSPLDASVDSSTNVFISDATRIRKIRPDGWVSTIAGTGVPGYQNGFGSLAQFNGAVGLCVDMNSNIYVADSGNNCIREISTVTAPPSLQITTSTNQIILSWPIWAGDFVLEAASALSTNSTWIPMTNGVTASVNNFVLTNNIGTASSFYRLYKP